MSSPVADGRGNAVVDRRAGRVLLVDRAGRALLLHGGDPARPAERWWFTPGGGLSGDETAAEGAARELFEETGLRVDPADLGERFFMRSPSSATTTGNTGKSRISFCTGCPGGRSTRRA